MKYILILIILIFAETVTGQIIDLNTDLNNQYRYREGSVLFKDSVRKDGEIIWLFGNKVNRIKFRDKSNCAPVTYYPDQILGFNIGPYQYRTLFDFDAYNAKYVSNKKLTRLEMAFCQVLHQGNINIYMVYVTGFDGLSGWIKLYPNFVFTKRLEDKEIVVTYPYGILMMNKKYELAKGKLYAFFKDYPDVIEKIRNWHNGNNFDEIIDIVKAL
jgi:hypothetical protein